MTNFSPALRWTATFGFTLAAIALLGNSAEAANLITTNSNNNVNATTMMANMRSVLPFFTFAALIATICIVVWLPRQMGLVLTSMAILLMGIFAEPVINLLYGSTTAVATGAELFPGRTVSAAPAVGRKAPIALGRSLSRAV